MLGEFAMILVIWSSLTLKQMKKRWEEEDHDMTDVPWSMGWSEA